METKKDTKEQFDSFTQELLKELTAPLEGEQPASAEEKVQLAKLFSSAKESGLTGPIVDFFKELVSLRRARGVTLTSLGYGLDDLEDLALNHQQIDEHMVSIGGRLTQRV